MPDLWAEFKQQELLDSGTARTSILFPRKVIYTERMQTDQRIYFLPWICK